MRTSHARLRKPCLEETLEASRAERPESNVGDKRGFKPVTIWRPTMGLDFDARNFRHAPVARQRGRGADQWVRPYTRFLITVTLL